MTYDSDSTLGKPMAALGKAELENLVLALLVEGKIDAAVIDGKIYTYEGKEEDNETGE